MTINIQKNGAVATFVVEGRLDTTTAPQLEKEISGLDVAYKNLILDLADLEYISSAGLRVLLGAQKKMSKIGSMKLTGVSETVMDVLEMTGFADILTIE
ncbi:MAG: STAS domain-containing protein [Ruminococcaceae bacterium]|nr:STAS domain-containing protein [Oscillospiraceae bacterium]